MMPQLNEMTERIPEPQCTRQQARRLLEELREAYQSLSPAERGLVKAAIAKAQRAEVLQEIEQEQECFGSAF